MTADAQPAEPTDTQKTCDHRRVVLGWTCPMDVVIDREQGVIADRRYIDEAETQNDPTDASCRDCHLTLPPDHPAVAQAQQIQDQVLDWPAGQFGW